MQALLLVTMLSFALALLRSPAISAVFEVVKFPILTAAVYSLFYARPIIKLNVSSIIMWLFVALVTFSTVYNSPSSPALVASIGVFVAIGIYFQAIANLNEPNILLEPLLRVFALVVALTSVVYLPFPSSYIGGRFAAGFINTNVAAGFFAIAVVVVSYTLMFDKLRMFHIFLLLVLVLLLLLTKGRGALIAAGIPVSIMLITNWRNQSKKTNLMRLILLVLAVWLSLKMDFGDTTDATRLGLLSYRAFELGAREMIIEQHLGAFWHSPFFGAGAVINKWEPYARVSGESSYSDLLALSGGIGISLIAVLIIRALLVHWREPNSRLGFYVLLTTLLLASSEGYFVSIASAVSIILWSLLAVSPSKAVSKSCCEKACSVP